MAMNLPLQSFSAQNLYEHTFPSKQNFKTFNIQEAANFLGVHKETARRLAATGVLPGVKIGRAWRFIEDDLEMYMRSLYANCDASQGVKARSIETWHYLSEVKSGGFVSATTAKEYSKALGLVTE